jgi:hypothetical protein
MMITVCVCLLASFQNANYINALQSSVQELPSISPEPTGSPAPSPSPSNIPTQTQAPSFSLSPTTTPTLMPSFEPSDTPSNNPTLYPTDSPAPSPSPSDIPTTVPSQNPSLSLHPSTSLQPSASPSKLPSEAPTISFEPSVSASPTGTVFLVAKTVKMILPDVIGTMNTTNIELFEEETKLYLQQKVHQAVGVWTIEVQSITVTDQSVIGSRRALDITSNTNLLRRAEQQESKSLLITFQAVASAILDRSENFDLTLFLEILFENTDNVLELRATLEQEESYSQAVLIEQPESDDTVGAAKGPTITGALFGVSMSMVGSALLYLWIKKRRVNRDSFGEDPNAALKDPRTFSRSYDSQDEASATSTPRAFVVQSRTFETFQNPYYGPFTFRIDDDDEERVQSPSAIETSIVVRGGHNDDLRYEPALIRTESNIEVPETPVTAFTLNRTTFSTQGDSRYEDGDSAIEKYIGIQKLPPTEDENSVGSVLGTYPATSRWAVGNPIPAHNAASNQKRKRFPNVFKSPFRRVKADIDGNDDNYKGEDHECDEVTSESGEILIAGRSLTKHNNRNIISNLVRDEKNDDNADPLGNDLSAPVPTTIGGPDSVPSLLVQSTMSRSNSVRIVDEIAYLYSKATTTGDSQVHESSNLSILSHSVVADYAAWSGVGDDDDNDDVKKCSPTRSSTNHAAAGSDAHLTTALDGDKIRPNGYLSDNGDNIEEIEVYEDGELFDP